MGSDRVLVRLSFWPDGVLKSATAEGHAGTVPAGSNTVCAAVTVLLRTAYETASGYDGVRASGRAPGPGFLGFTIGRYPPEMVDRLRGVADFLVIGLSSVEREHPGRIELRIEN